MSKSELVLLAIVSVIGAVGGWWLLKNGACSDLDECVEIRNCAASESCSVAFFSVVAGIIGIIVTTLDIVVKHMER